MKNFTQLACKNRGLFITAFCFSIIAGLAGCKKMQYPLVPINKTLNITSYLEANPTQFSLFDQILQRTGYDGFLNAYGSYTVFVPNNDAVNLYLKSKGKTSVNDINVDTLKDLVKFHVILGDTITSTYFVDGKLRSPTFLQQYLSSSVVNDGGTSSFFINKQAKVLQTNIILGNGIMHVIDHVLSPATQTLAQIIDANPKYKIFSAALKATGFYDTLNVSGVVNPNKARNYFTVFAQTDSVYAVMGITTVAQLQAKYATSTNSLRNPTDGFYLYMSYHIVPENSYLTDILSKPSHSTLSPNQDVITDVLQVQNIQLDYDLINGVQYPGVSVDRANSNIPSTNGVLHRILGDLYIKIFPPTRVDWDLADQPEFRKLTSVFRRAGQSSNPLTSPMQNMSWNNPAGGVTYICNSTTSGNYYWWNDCIQLDSWRNSPSSQITDITFTTPTIIKGKYKVWFMYQRGVCVAGAQFFFDGAPLQNVIPNFNTANYQTPADSGPVMESKGFKRYTEAPYSLTTNVAYNTNIGFLCGVVTVPTTDHHQFSMVAIGTAKAGIQVFDMVQFIPVDQDQESPRYFRRDGSVGN
ncbi:hypothetical protein BEL04_16900 [Mucilaginibacter sp. PPCGB 2223]|uniref:fasciclin domain-containing protein n=1 Tax=Mucilaginibacter sp. PPCGB 2223 TaxID=1886027 RepID=UPI0008241F4A|nr:fasciclin domain-containing protein [Mucilaginibacter sp. PPCGB 2223]OCX51694.1 hypothetical protein BEL04_16900 [Mucilaginibacter sp. PPCGB 2223]